MGQWLILLQASDSGHSPMSTEKCHAARLCVWSMMLGMEVTLNRTWRLGACLALICGGSAFAVAGSNPPAMTASQKTALDRAFEDLRETRELQTLERLGREVRPGDRRGSPRRQTRSRYR